MRRPLILTGGPAVGKSTCGRLLAAGRPRSAFVDADDIRQLVVSGAATLWTGAEGERQHDLAARNTAALARNLVGAGFEVVVADVLTPSSLAVYRAELPDAVVVRLAVTLAGARARAATRRVLLTDDEFVLLHRMVAEPLDADLAIEVDGMTVDEQVARIDEVWAAASV